MPQQESNDTPKETFWHSIVVPTAKGLEDFFWRLAWFGLIVGLFFSGCLQQYVMQSTAKDDKTSEPEQQVVLESPRPPRPGQ